MRCSRCGKENPESLRFCQDCGNRLHSAAGWRRRGLRPLRRAGLRRRALQPPRRRHFPPPARRSSPAAGARSPCRRRRARLRSTDAKAAPAAPSLDFGQRPPSGCVRAAERQPSSAAASVRTAAAPWNHPPEPATAPQAPQPRAPRGSPTRRYPRCRPSPLRRPASLICPRCRGSNSPQCLFANSAERGWSEGRKSRALPPTGRARCKQHHRPQPLS